MEKYFRAAETIDDKTVNVHYMLDTKGYANALGICTAYCFSIATMVARTRLSITLYTHCLSCLTLNAAYMRNKLKILSVSKLYPN
jgi:hypothetical protein